VSSFPEAIKKFREQIQSLGKRKSAGSDAAAAPAGKKGGFDAKALASWAKANPAVVASVAAMLLVPPAAWWFSSEMHASRSEAAKKRASEFAALDKYEKTTVELTLPGKQPEQLPPGVVGERTVTAYKRLTSRLSTDAMEVQKSALDRNGKGRDKLFADIRITKENNNTIAETVFSAVIARAKDDLKRLGAGMPPSDQAVVDQLQRAQDQFIARERKPDRKSLGEEQLQLLRAQLVDKRLQMYGDAARGIAFYASVSDLGLPSSAGEAGKEPTEAALFGWQWRLWVIEDVLEAFAEANKPYKSVIEAPVKRVLSVAVREDVVAPPPAVPAGDPPADGIAPVDAAAAPLPPIDPKAAVTYDFGKSITGRVSNSLYDVRPVTVRLVVATAAIPELLNAVGRQNFMTVTSFEMQPADAFEAADRGFIYGSEPVSEVRMTIETIWLRPWIARLMPRELQVAKGTDGRTSDDPPPAPAEPPAEQPAS
jgi:hypothetical protein